MRSCGREEWVADCSIVHCGVFKVRAVLPRRHPSFSHIERFTVDDDKVCSHLLHHLDGAAARHRFWNPAFVLRDVYFARSGLLKWSFLRFVARKKNKIVLCYIIPPQTKYQNAPNPPPNPLNHRTTPISTPGIHISTKQPPPRYTGSHIYTPDVDSHSC